MTILKRWYGLDLFRGLAVGAVILVHADEATTEAPVGWGIILRFAAFAVPFFLAGSFFLSTKKLLNSEKPYPLVNRLKRLGIPYIFWTLFYLIYTVAKYTIDGDLNSLSQLFSHPINIFLFGGAAFHLYFIPLLITGTLLLKVFDLINIKHLKQHQTMCLWIISLTIYQIVLNTNNQVKLVSFTAFTPLLTTTIPQFYDLPLVNFLSVEIAWALQCLPYLFSAILIYQHDLHLKISRANYAQKILIIVAFCLINGTGYLFIPSALQKVLRGYTALFAAIAISSLLRKNSIITSIGASSFGIYLMHLIIIDICQITSNRFNFPNLSHPSLFTLFAVTTFSFTISWILCIYLMKFKKTSRLMFGN